jgi:hypothetical protein
MSHIILSSDEITDILNNPIVQINKEKLSTLQKVDFSIQLSDVIKNKLEIGLGINLMHIHSFPMRWIKGDTAAHIDRGEKHFHNTYLVYLTDSIGNLIIHRTSYPITAGDAHIFNEGLEHYTINNEDSERLMIGPMSEMGLRVGETGTIYYFDNETDATTRMNAIHSSYYNTENYTLKTVNGISSWIILTNNYGTNPTSNGGPYNSGTTLNATGTYYLYPYVAPTTTTTTSRFSMKSLYTNNAQVYYKPHSLSTGGGGSGVKNHRHKQRKT